MHLVKKYAVSINNEVRKAVLGAGLPGVSDLPSECILLLRVEDI